jgi:hypothetical protein
MKTNDLYEGKRDLVKVFATSFFMERHDLCQHFVPGERIC